MYKFLAVPVALLLTSCPSGAEAVVLKSEAAFRPPEGTVPWHEAAETPDQPRDGYPRNYFVPNFGEDKEITDSKKHMAMAEEKLNHTLEASFDPPKEPKRDYFVPQFGMDDDIVDSLRHMHQQESKHGNWAPEFTGDGSWELKTGLVKA